MVAAAPADTAYAHDVGLLRDGATTLLGVQDPLDAQLLPTGADRPSNYDFLRMLWGALAWAVPAARLRPLTKRRAAKRIAPGAQTEPPGDLRQSERAVAPSEACRH